MNSHIGAMPNVLQNRTEYHPVYQQWQQKYKIIKRVLFNKWNLSKREKKTYRQKKSDEPV